LELQEFLSRVVGELIGGVVEAQRSAEQIGARVNPQMKQLLPKEKGGFDPHGWAQAATGNPVISVAFDVAVTVLDGTAKKAGIGVVGGVLGLGGASQTEQSNSSVSRISFRLPILLPLHEDTLRRRVPK
jgi:hypothetical protein